YQGLDNHLSPYPDDPSKCIPEYTSFHGWTLDPNHQYQKVSEFPSEFRQYIEFIETTLNIPIKLISFGPERQQILAVDN
ncbi:MAG: adenylosuccinate synthetase, partial [Bacteroidota bacterium]